MDLFKPEYKFYKRRVPPIDLSTVIDFSNDAAADDYVVELDVTDVNVQAASVSFTSRQFAEVGLRPPQTWRIHGLRQCPGLYFIRNPFLAEGQRSWIRRCIVEFPRKPNRTNVDAILAGVARDSLWNYHVQNKDDSFLSKLRWVTLGYHHDWDTKVYNFNEKEHLPDELRMLSRLVTSVLGFEYFSAEAAIVNFYDLSSSLGGHTDHSEVDHSSPLLSISFGQTAVFLLGGPTKERKPVAMYLKSGDVIVMSGSSRLAYHAVPRILPATEKPWTIVDYDPTASSDDWTLLDEYIDRIRINMNIRQVFPTVYS